MSSLKDFTLKSRGVNLVLNQEAELKPDSPIVIDIETDEKDNFVGIGFTQDGINIHYHSIFNQDYLTAILLDRGLIGHNLKGDIHWLNKYGIYPQPNNFSFDSMIASYILNPQRESHSLKALAKEFLKFQYPTYKEMVGSGRKKLTLDKQHTDLVANYCGSDVYATYQLWKRLEADILQDPSYINAFALDMKVMRLLYEMERDGITINADHLKSLGVQFTKELESLDQQMSKIFGRKINLRSPIQLAEVLYGQLKLPTIYKTTKHKDRKTGIVSWIKGLTTDREALSDLEGEHEVIPLIQRYRELDKLNSTYIKGILKLPTLPKIHTTFNQVSTKKNLDDWEGIKTGRLSSSEPNLHSIPSRTKTGKLLRQAFITSSPTKKLLCFDYSQIEYRLLAHLTNEPMLLHAYRAEKDAHEETGRLFGVGRDLGKTLNFAAIYGAQPKKLARTAKISKDAAEKLFTQYWAKLPYVQVWVKLTKLLAAKHNYVTTITGRKIPIINIHNSNRMERYKAERQAVNFVIQGSAADVIKLAMVKCREELGIPVLQIHDELLFEVDEKDVDILMQKIKGIMESVVTLRVPLVVQSGYGNSWAEAKP